MPWVYGSEIMPLRLRQFNGAVTGAGEWLETFTVIEMGEPAMRTAGWKMYLFFMTFNIISILFIYFLCPETKNKTLEEIDLIFRKEKCDIENLEPSTTNSLKINYITKCEETSLVN